MLRFVKRAFIFLTQPLAKRIGILLVFIWLLTAVGYYYGLQNNSHKLIGPLFASWMGDVLFFSVVGPLLAIVSSMPPALEPYEKRVNILLQGRSGSQVDYAKSVLAKLGTYSLNTEILIAIHDDEDDWFRMVATSNLEIKNLIEDVITTHRMHVRDSEQSGNPVGKIGTVISYSVDDEEHFSSHTSQLSEQEYTVEIGGDAAKHIKITRQYWIKDGGFDTHSPARYTKRLSLSLVNQSHSPVFVKLAKPLDKPLIELGPSQKVDLLPQIENIEPTGPAYEFYISRKKQALRVRRGSTAPLAHSKVTG